MQNHLLSVRLLGSFDVTLEGRPVAGFDSNKVRALLAYLVMEAERPLHRAMLAGLLWPDRSDQNARTNLRRALSNLRKVLRDRVHSPPFLTVTPQTVQFNRTSDSWVDVIELQKLSGGQVTPENTIPCLESAAALYRGEFLDGFFLSGCQTFDEWSLLTRERLCRKMIAIFTRLITCCEQKKDYEQALIHAWRVVELGPWQEESHRKLMYLLSQTGRRSTALAQYERCRRILGEELGVEPEAETRQLHRRIRDMAGVERRVSSPEQPHLYQHNLPSPTSPFFGREGELAKIGQLLADPDCRLLTLTGPGGIGKTRLALKASEQQLPHFTDGVFFVPLVSCVSQEAVLPSIAEALGISFHPQRQLLLQIRDHLRQRTLLLVLDNFEHLQGSAGLVTKILESAPGVKVLATSRVRLDLQGEYLLCVEGMGFPEAESRASQALASSAIRLFCASARRVQPDFELTAENIKYVIKICAQVQGMPLGIILAASWVALLTPAEIVAEMAQDVDFLGATLQDLPPRQRSLRATFDHSWNLLTKREQEAFSGLSIFRGGFSRAAAGEVVEITTQELLTLMDKSLLIRDTTGRQSILEPLRQFAAEKLEQDPVHHREICDRLSRYFAGLLSAWEQDLKGPRQQAVLLEMDADIENARSAWRWMADRGALDRMNASIEGLCLYYEWRIRYREGQAVCQLAADKLEVLGDQIAFPPQAALLFARVLRWQSFFTGRLGDRETGYILLGRSLALLNGPARGASGSLAAKADVLYRMGRKAALEERPKARLLFQQSLELYEKAGVKWGEANVYSASGALAWNTGNYQEAKGYYKKSLALRKKIGDQKGIAHGLMSLGVNYLYDGDFEAAKRLVQEGCDLRQEIGDQFGIAEGFRNLGITLTALGEFDKAYAALEKSLAIYDDLGLQYSLEISMLARVLLHLGQFDQAVTQAEKACAVAGKTGFKRGLALGTMALGEVALARQDYSRAREMFQKCYQVYQPLGQREQMCVALSDLSLACLGDGEISLAEQNLCAALRLALDIHAVLPLLWVLPSVALLFAAQGKEETAGEVYSAVWGFPCIARSRWVTRVIHRDLIAKLDRSFKRVAGKAPQPRVENLWETARIAFDELICKN